MPIGLIVNEEEQIEIQVVFDRLMNAMIDSLKDEDKINLNRAFNLANDAHKYQRRKSGEPYIFHPLEVARICFEEIGLGPTAVICALLHDVVEDTEVTLEEIHETFGEKIGKIVDGLTKLDGLYNVESKQAENFKKVLSTLVEDVRVVLIKLADRLHNLRTIEAMPQHKQLKIGSETSYIYIPLAHRLGLYKIKTELQDICLKISEPEVYRNIASKLEDSQSQRSKYIKEFISPLEKELDKLGIKYTVLGRAKAISSIYNKLKSKQIPFEEIYDIFAVRIIADVPRHLEKSMCWQIYSIITDVFRPIPERLKDWVTTPKGNGYESLHTTVIGPKGRYVEVQIRTIRMDDIAEKGFAAHWKYKGVKSQNNVFDAWLDNIREIMDANHTNALEFLNDFKTNLFSEEIYTYTPTGEMKILPKGATALDFAFDIHTDIGYHATALKVNNKLVPMGYKLQNGDQIHVTTSKNQKPKEEWLNLVVTGKAKAKIRSSMKEERKKLGSFGKEIVERKFKHLKINYDDNIEFLYKKLGFNSRTDLFYAIYAEEIKISNEFKKFTVETGKLVEKVDPLAVTEIVEPPVKKKPKKKENKSNILVNGERGDIYEFSFASCCNPVKGDPIFGYLTSKNQLKIHRTSCDNAEHLLANFGYRVLKTEWDNNLSGNFIADLVVNGVDSGVGVIQMLTNEISNKLGLNIRSLSIQGEEGYFEGKISVFVTNKDQLNVALKTISNLEGVSSVERSYRTN